MDMELSNVHEALQRASIASEPTESVTQTFRVGKDIKDIVESICARHDTTVSAFLRECCEQLTEDYGIKPRKI